MKLLACYIALSCALLVVTWAMLNPHSGVAYDSPLTTIGLVMIGLGLCIEARGRLAPAYATRRRRKVKK